MFQNIKKAFGKIGCQVGVHDFEWNYVSPDSCALIGKCKRENCGKTKETITHTWGDWNYTKNNSCLQEIKCTRCKEKQERIRHNWSNWRYEKDGECQQISTCLRCNEIQRGQVKHDLGNWHYEQDGECQRVAICLRCKEIQYGDIEHIWEPYQYESETSCHQISYCRRCNEMTDHQEDYSHKWSDWVVDYQTKRWKRKCAHCGEEEFGNLAPSPKPTVVNNIHNHEQVIIRPEGNKQVFIDKRNSRKRN